RQLLGEPRPTKTAVAFAKDEFRGNNAIVCSQPTANHNAQRVDVAIHRPKLFAHLLAGRDDPTVSGSRRIDEDEIGEVEPGLFVVDEGRCTGLDAERPFIGSRQGPIAPSCNQAEPAPGPPLKTKVTGLV